MSRNLKVLGLALVAVLALCAVSVSAAFALTPKVQVGTGDGNIVATQIGTNKLTVSGGRTVQCSSVRLTASLWSVNSTIENILPTYTGCTSTLAGVVFPATVTTLNPAECTYRAHIGATTGTADQYAATADLRCPTGKRIEIYVYEVGTTPEHHEAKKELCHYAIEGGGEPPALNQGLGAPTVTNITTGTSKYIEVDLNFSGIDYTRTFGTLPTCGKAFGEATLTGKLTVTGTTTAGAITDVQIVEV